MNISKMGLPALEKAIAAGKFEGDALIEATALVEKRKLKKLNPKGDIADKAPEEAAPVEVKAEEEAPKAKKGKKTDLYPKGTLSGLVRKMITPKEGDETKTAGCTYGQASKAVEKKFGRALHPSEFSRNFEFLFDRGIVLVKRTARVKESVA